ncbi:MAG: TolC family protein [Acidobacteriota bacterium]
MTNRACLLIFTLLLLGSTTNAFAQQPVSSAVETLTLEQAINLALNDNRQLKNSDIEVKKYGDRIAATRTLKLPSFKVDVQASQLLTPLNFTFDKGTFGTFEATGPIPNEDTTISTARKPTLIVIGQVTQPLSQLYRINLNLKQLNVGREIAEQQSRAQKQTIVNQVKRAYYAVLQTQSALLAIEESLKLYEELERVTTDYVAQQVALKSENLDVKTRYAKAEYDALNLRNTLATQKEQLNHLMGRDIRAEFTLNAVPEATSFENNLAAARTRAIEQRPEVQEGRLKIKQAELDRRIKKSEFIPDVGLGLTYISPLNLNSIVPKTIATFGVTFSWEIFDWGKKRRELDEKSRIIEQATNGLADVESQVLMDVNNRHRQLQQTRQSLRIALLSQDTAREQLRVVSHKYRVQMALLKDVLEVQTRLADANNQYQQALLAYWSAKADFEKAIGEDK